LAVDLKSAEGLAIVQKLIATAEWCTTSVLALVTHGLGEEGSA
jgi:hypothetical protein